MCGLCEWLVCRCLKAVGFVSEPVFWVFGVCGCMLPACLCVRGVKEEEEEEEEEVHGHLSSPLFLLSSSSCFFRVKEGEEEERRGETQRSPTHPPTPVAAAKCFFREKQGKAAG